MNDPIISYQSAVNSKQSNVTRHTSLVSCDSANVIIETVKRAEDGNGTIVRLYESQRKRGQVRVRVGGGIESAWETNLLEEDQSQLLVESDQVILHLRPYQIMTLRLKTKK